MGGELGAKPPPLPAKRRGRVLPGFKHGAKVFQKAVENQGITRKRIKAKMRVERGSGFVFCMDEQGAHAGDVGDLKRASDRVENERRAKAFALP